VAWHSGQVIVAVVTTAVINPKGNRLAVLLQDCAGLGATGSKIQITNPFHR